MELMTVFLDLQETDYISSTFLMLYIGLQKTIIYFIILWAMYMIVTLGLMKKPISFSTINFSHNSCYFEVCGITQKAGSLQSQPRISPSTSKVSLKETLFLFSRIVFIT